MYKIINFIKTFIAQKIMKIKKVRPKDNFWLFSSTDNNHFNYNSKYLFEYVLNNEQNIKAVFVINDDILRKDLSTIYGEEKFIETKTFKGILTALEAGVWFTSAGLPVYGLNLLNNRKIINLWHGVPLKKIALLEPYFPWYKKLYFNNLFSKNYTYVLTTSKHLIPLMSESFNVSSNIIKVWGQPRNDLLYEDKFDNIKKLESIFEMKISSDYNILYAPTFRSQPTKLFPFEDFDFENFKIFLRKHKIRIFIRTHISESNLQKKFESDRIHFVNEDKILDIMEVINVFDLLITDYSSIYIDYLLLERPIVFLPYDIEEYTSQRGFNFEYDEVTPGPKPITYSGFKEEILKFIHDSTYYKEEIMYFNNFFNEFQGHSCKKIVKQIKNNTRINSE